MTYLIFFFAAVAMMYFLLSSPNKKPPATHDDAKINGKLLRGTRVVGTNHAAEIVAQRNDKLGATLAGIPIPRDAEVNNFLFQGAPGTGKSLAFIQMLGYARQAGHRAVVVDNNADFLRRFYRPGDIILNPFDQRSEAWSPFSEMRNPYDSMRLAKSIVPDGQGESKVWASYSQNLISAVLLRLWEKGGSAATTSEMVRLLTVSPVEELKALCAGLPASTLSEEGAERMFAGIRADVGSKLAAFAYLKQGAGMDSFSLTDFIQKDDKKWVFLSYRDDQFDMLAPLIAAQLDVLISATLSLRPDPDRRIFFALDEFATLGKIQSADNLLTKGRKFGASAIIGLQTISQFRSSYGRDGAQTLLSCLGTSLCLRSPDPDTAETMSKLLGKQEVLRTTESASTGGTGGGTSSWSQQVAETFTVMPSTLQNLPKCEGYLALVGDYHPARVTVPFPAPSPDVAPAFVDRDFRAEALAEATARTQAEATKKLNVLEMTDSLL